MAKKRQQWFQKVLLKSKYLVSTKLSLLRSNEQCFKQSQTMGSGIDCRFKNPTFIRSLEEFKLQEDTKEKLSKISKMCQIAF